MFALLVITCGIVIIAMFIGLLTTLPIRFRGGE